MILNHLWGLYAHPKEEWQTIDARHESFGYSMSHILLIALVPSIMGYFSSVYLGWSVGVGDRIFLTESSAMLLAISMYFALIAGVFTLAYLAHWMAITFGAEPSYTQTLDIIAKKMNEQQNQINAAHSLIDNLQRELDEIKNPTLFDK